MHWGAVPSRRQPLYLLARRSRAEGGSGAEQADSVSKGIVAAGWSRLDHFPEDAKKPLIRISRDPIWLSYFTLFLAGLLTNEAEQFGIHFLCVGPDDAVWPTLNDR